MAEGFFYRGVQIGASSDPAKNFVFEVPPIQDGTARVIRGDGLHVLDIDAAGKVSFPATPGSILQDLMFADNGTAFNSGTYINVTGSAKVITPRSTNSKIIISCSFYGYNAGGSGAQYANYVINADGATISPDVSFGANAGVQIYGTPYITAILANTTLTPKSFLLYAKTTAASPASGAINQVWRITEVQN